MPNLPGPDASSAIALFINQGATYRVPTAEQVEKIDNPAQGVVQSVNGKSGAVTLTPADVGAATATQGAKADTAVQPGNTGLITTDERDKLAGLESSKYLGTYTTLAALDAAHPSPPVGSYAHVDAGAGADVQVYIWDASDDAFVVQAGSGTAETAASVKAKYESNPNTNPFTDADKERVDGAVQDGDAALITEAERAKLGQAIVSSTTQAGGGTAVANVVQISRAAHAALANPDATTLYAFTD